MTALIFLKALGDYAFYYTFAGTLAAIFGARPGVLFLSVGVAACCTLLACLAAKNTRWRFAALPLSLLVIFGVVPTFDLPEVLAALPALGYLVFLMRKGRYAPDRGEQVELFSLFWKVFLALAGAGILYGRADVVTAFTLPCGALGCAVSILLTRSLRHDSQVYEDRRYQLTNLLTVAAVGLVILLLSSGPFLALCTRSLGAIYRAILVPVLSAALWCIGMAVYGGIGLLAGLIDPAKKENPTQMPDFGAGLDQLKDLQESVETGAYWGDLLLALAAVTVIVAGVLLLRRLASSRAQGTAARQVQRDSRTYAPPLATASPQEEDSRAARRVRSQYRKFLRLCLEEGLPLTPSQTSGDIAELSKGRFDDGASSQLRQLYLRARYDNDADQADAQRAKELLGQLKK